MQPRYFIGLTLPRELSDKISRVQAALFTPGRIMQPLTPHITLLAPNTLMTLAPLYFIPRVRTAAQPFLPLEIHLTGCALFDKRVLHIAVDSPHLMDFQAALAELLPDKVRAQYEVGRPYTPHVTVAQAKPRQNLSDDQIDRYRQQLDPLLPQTFTATKLSQFKWLRPRTYQVSSI